MRFCLPLKCIFFLRIFDHSSSVILFFLMELSLRDWYSSLLSLSFSCSLSRFLFQFSSVAQSCLTLCDPMDCSTPGLPVHHQLPEFTHVHWVNDSIQSSQPLSSPSSPTISLSQHQGLLEWVSSSHQMAKVLEFQPQHQSFQWIFRTDFL